MICGIQTNRMGEEEKEGEDERVRRRETLREKDRQAGCKCKNS